MTNRPPMGRKYVYEIISRPICLSSNTFGQYHYITHCCALKRIQANLEMCTLACLTQKSTKHWQCCSFWNKNAHIRYPKHSLRDIEFNSLVFGSDKTKKVALLERIRSKEDSPTKYVQSQCSFKKEDIREKDTCWKKSSTLTLRKSNKDIVTVGRNK